MRSSRTKKGPASRSEPVKLVKTASCREGFNQGLSELQPLMPIADGLPKPQTNGTITVNPA